MVFAEGLKHTEGSYKGCGLKDFELNFLLSVQIILQ